MLAGYQGVRHLRWVHSTDDCGASRHAVTLSIWIGSLRVKIVVDLGCAPHHGINSLRALARKYEPGHIYGFDPCIRKDRETTARNIPVTLTRSAAWLYDGTVIFHEDGWASRVAEYGDYVPCFDFSAWLRTMRKRDKLIVKMDIEGAEVQLLERMKEDGTDGLVDELLVEWHGATGRGLRCPVREWWM